MSQHEVEPFLNDSDPESLTVVDDEPEKPLGPSKLLLTTLFFGAFLGQTDETFVLTTASQIAESLGRASDALWLLTGYNLGYSMALPLYGRLYEVFGQRRTFLVAYSLYAMGCATTGLSNSFFLVATGRFLAGFGGSGMMDLASVVINDLASLREVAVLRSYYTMVVVLGTVVGAPLGAFLTSTIGWRASFLAHLPLVLVCATVTLVKLPAKPTSSSGKASPEEHFQSESHSEKNPAISQSLDIPGILSLSCTIFCFVLLVQQLTESDVIGGDKTLIIILGASLLIFGTLFGIIELFWASNPVIPFYLVGSTQVGLQWGGTFFLNMGLFGLNAFIGPYFARVSRFSTVERGLSHGPLALGACLGSIFTGRIVKRTGRQKTCAAAGLGVGIISLILILIRWSFFKPSGYELLYTFIFGFGVSMTLSAQFVTLSSNVPEKSVATAITSYYLFQQAGIMIGVGLTQCTQHLMFRKQLEAGIGTNADVPETIEHIMDSVEYSWSLPDPLHGIADSLFRESFIVVPVFGVISFCLSLLLVLRQKDVPV